MSSVNKDEIYSMQDLVEQEQLQQRQAQAIASQAGDQVDKCSFAKGYHSQPVYSCLTCHPNQPIALCLGCSMNCHLDHQVEELFTKRHIRCDCGNSVAQSSCKYTCDLFSDKTEVNDENVYSHNWFARYCHCDGTYDPQNTSIMYQCFSCEDWFHDSCVNSPDNLTDQQEFICRNCLVKTQNDVLLPYIIESTRQFEELKEREQQFLAVLEDEDKENQTNTTIEQNGQQSKQPNVKASPKSATRCETSSPSKSSDSSSETILRKRKREDEEAAQPNANDSSTKEQNDAKTAASSAASSPNRSVSPSDVCKRIVFLPADFDNRAVQDTFTAPNWRTILCECTDCIKLFKSRKLFYLLEAEDDDDDEQEEQNQNTGNANNLLNISTTVANQIDELNIPLIDPNFSPESLALSAIERLPRDVTLAHMERVEYFNSSIRRQLAELKNATSDIVITQDIIQHIVQKAKQESAVQSDTMTNQISTEIV